MGEQTFVRMPAATTKPLKKSFMNWFNGDILLLIITILLIAFGLVMVYSSSWNFSILHYDSPEAAVKRQLLWAAIGLVGGVFSAMLNYHTYKRWALPIIGITILFLIAVLVAPSGDVRSRGTLFGLSVQPSELAKLGIIIYLSVWLYSKQDILHNIFFGLVPLSAIVGSIAGLIALQPDLSATLSIVILGGILFYLANSDVKQIIILILLVGLFGAVFIALSETGKVRINEYIAGFKNVDNASEHIRYSWRAIAEGGLFGKGLGKGSIKLIGLPVAWTDSIFSVIAEELGIIGATLVLASYVFILWRGIRIARRAPDQLGKLLACGITFWITFEAMLNMGVMVNLLPFAGNPLPFISTGGSSLVISMVAIGILFNISKQGKENLTEERSDQFAAYRRSRRDRRRSVPSSRRSPSAQI